METTLAPRRVPLLERLGSLDWLRQAVSGLALVALAGLHMTANHFMVAGGLRNFAQVQAYLRSPVIFGLEAMFLIVVVWHAMLGVRAVLLDLDLSRQAQKLASDFLTVLGVVTVVYGLWLTWVIIHM